MLRAFGPSHSLTGYARG